VLIRPGCVGLVVEACDGQRERAVRRRLAAQRRSCRRLGACRGAARLRWAIEGAPHSSTTSGS